MKKELIFGLVISILILGLSGWLVSRYQSENSFPIAGLGQVNTNSNLPAVAGGNNVSLAISEVAKHNTAADCWLVIENNVYNVTSYIDQHPGGRQAVISSCGQDATTVFNDKHRPGTIQKLSSYLLGALGQLVGQAEVNKVTIPNNINMNNQEAEQEDD